jgi:hypothetical protein
MSRTLEQWIACSPWLRSRRRGKAEFVAAVAAMTRAVVAFIAQAVGLLANCPQMETHLNAWGVGRAGGSHGLWRGRRCCRGGDILPLSAIVHGE